MPVYHFEVRRINETFSDADGLVFDNFGDAWEEATVAAPPSRLLIPTAS